LRQCLANIYGCTFTRNTAHEGGAIATYTYQKTTVSRSIFNGNSTNLNGGAIWFAKDILIENCTFVGNYAPHKGSAVGCSFFMYQAGVAPVYIINCTFTGHLATDDGGIFAGGFQPLIDLQNCIVWNNESNDGSAFGNSGSLTLGVRNSIVDGGYVGEGNLDLNPKFVTNASPGADSEWGTSDDNYGNLRLQITSPAINAGSSSAIKPIATNDLADGLRISGLSVDLGAFENQPTPFALRESDLLTITGSTDSDIITLTKNGDWLTATRNGKSLRFHDGLLNAIKIFGGAGSDNITIGTGVRGSYMAGEDDNDTLRGGDGNDTLSGGAQKDKLYGGAGLDRIGGNGGNDSLYGDADDDRLYGDDGADYLDGGLRVDRLYGGLGNDTLIGGKSNDKLYGDAGNDRLDGNEGNDLISGGSGTDSAVDDEGDSLVTSIEILL